MAADKKGSAAERLKNLRGVVRAASSATPDSSAPAPRNTGDDRAAFEWANASRRRPAPPPPSVAPQPPEPAPRPQRDDTAPAQPSARDRISLVRSMIRNIEEKDAGTPAGRAAAPASRSDDSRRRKSYPVQAPSLPPVASAPEIDPEEAERLKAAFEADEAERAARLQQAHEAAMRASTAAPEPVAPIVRRAVPPRRTDVPPRPKAKRTPPFAAFEWGIASRYLRARRKEGFISVIAGFSLVGIALGVATLIIVMAVMTGFRATLIDQILGVNSHVSIVSQSESFDQYDTMAAAIRKVDGVERVWPSLEGQVLASAAGGHSGVVVRGVRREDIRDLKVVANPEASVGSIEDFSGDNGIAIGEGVARKLGLRLGDSLTLVSPDGDLTPFGITPRSKSYPILYIFKLGLSQYDSAFAFMPLEEAQLYFNKKGQVDSLEVMVSDPNTVEEYRQPIREAARQSVGIYTWKDLQGSLIGALDVERNVMFLILTLIILVAALNIISGLVMLVKDKARDVAIMRTMGMSRGSILRIFFICGSSIGVVGSVLGCILGVLFCLNISTIQSAVESVTGPVFPADVYGLSGLPARMETGDVLLTLCIALGLSFVATLYPSWKAAKLDPVEALRYE